jgi:parallel beta-helix repeat protein
MARKLATGFLVFAFILFPAAQVPPAAAQTAITACGSVSSNSILAADLTSTGSCLTFTASGISLDLNGHSITNTTSAPVSLPGFCPAAKINYKGQGTSAAGIDTNGQSNLLIKGPGTISGYHVGVFITVGSEVNVRDLLVTGTTAILSGDSTSKPFVNCNPRPHSVGIEAFGTNGVNIHGNTVENQTEGIELVNVTAVGAVSGNVGFNTLRRNNSDPNQCSGVFAFNTSGLNFNNNVVTLNGESLGIDSGIILQGSSTGGNTVVHNQVNNNFGDGISLRFGAHDNQIVNNSAVGNPSSPGTIPFFDLAQRFAGANNHFVNNTFGTKNF